MTDTPGPAAEGADFTVGAPDFDTAALMEEIRARVAEKMSRGAYADPRVARAERANLANLRNEEEFLDFYLGCLRESFFVDINDFEIIERRGCLRPLLVAFKKVVWKLLKFYTYRLWSQQNQVNDLVLSTIDVTDHLSRSRCARLEQRIAALEAALNAGPPAPSAPAPYKPS